MLQIAIFYPKSVPNPYGTDNTAVVQYVNKGQFYFFCVGEDNLLCKQKAAKHKLTDVIATKGKASGVVEQACAT